MGDLLEGEQQNQELEKEMVKIKQVIEKKLTPILKQNSSEEIKYNSLADTITLHLNIVARKEREAKLFSDKLEL